MEAELMTQGTQIQELLGLKVPAVAIAFRDTAPVGIPRVTAPAPAGCGYWKLAAEGQVFYTEASDHYTCPVGAHTHGVNLPPQPAVPANEKDRPGAPGGLTGVRRGDNAGRCFSASP